MKESSRLNKSTSSRDRSTSESPEDSVDQDLQEDADFFEGFEGDDDVFHRSGRKKVTPRGGSESTKVTYATLPTSVKVGVVIALIVGVLTGIWVAGGSGSQTSDPFAGQEMPEGHPDISQMGSEETSLVAGETGVGESIAELTALVAREPDNLDARLDLGVAYFNVGEVEEARKQWQQVLADDPDNLGALYSMGFYYMAQDTPDVTAAEDAWHRVIELAPESVEAANAEANLQALSQ